MVLLTRNVIGVDNLLEDDQIRRRGLLVGKCGPHVNASSVDKLSSRLFHLDKRPSVPASVPRDWTNAGVSFRDNADVVSAIIIIASFPALVCVCYLQGRCLRADL